MHFERSPMDESFIYVQASVLGASKEPKTPTVKLDEKCENRKQCKDI